MDINNIRLFVLAAEKQNIGSAGRDLRISPAQATTRLAKLEAELGVELLHRSTRKVSLSQDGADYLPYAREILAQDDAARAALGKQSMQLKGTIRFAASSTFAQLYIAPLVPDFLAAYPSLALDLKFSDTQFNLIEGSFDLALRSGPLVDSALKGRKLADDPRILCASPDYLSTQNLPLDSVNDLAKHSLIGFRDGAPRPLAREGKIVGNFDPNRSAGRLIVDDGTSQKVATMAGAGISANSLWSVHEQIMSGELVHVLPDLEVADGAVLWLVYPQSNILSPKVRALIDFLMNRIGKSPPWLDGKV